MILSLALAIAAAGAKPPAAQTATAPVLTVSALRAACVAGVDGNAAGLDSCQSAIRTQASKLKPDGSGSCMSSASPTDSELVWTYLDWLKDNPQDDASASEPGIIAALLDKYPCGIS